MRDSHYLLEGQSQHLMTLNFAEAGDVSAQMELAAVLCTLSVNNPSEKDPIQRAAVRWLTAAANNHHPMATCNLGACYMTGTGVKQDLGVAARLFKKADQMFVDVSEEFKLIEKASLGMLSPGMRNRIINSSYGPV